MNGVTDRFEILYAGCNLCQNSFKTIGYSNQVLQPLFMASISRIGGQLKCNKDMFSRVDLCAEHNGDNLKSIQHVFISLFKLSHQDQVQQRHPGPSGSEVS